MVGPLPGDVEMRISTLLRLLNFPEENKITLLAPDEEVGLFRMVIGLVTFVSGIHWQHLKIFFIQKFLAVSSNPCLINWFVLPNI